MFVSLALGAGADAEPAPPGRPRIGLVLSGGGARGIAHVGVLRALEELRIPIDAIAGTSMGAVVGGLYASGLSPEEIEKAFRDIEWSTAFDDSTARDRLSFRRKQDDQGVLFNFQVGVRSGRLRVPRGLVQGQKFNLILRRLTLPVATVRDFDQLAIPFRAVAADLGTGEQVVMATGDLVLALRASMAVPGVFSPVEREGRHLVDGSIADNLPIDVARTMGVDRLIVVDISEPLGTAASLDSPVAITNQVFTLLIRKTTEERKKSLVPDDLLIVPEMEVGSAQFDRIDRAIEGGRLAVEKDAARLSALALSAPEYERWAARHEEERGADAEAIRNGGPWIAQIEIRSDSRRTDELIRRRMRTRPGERLKIDALTSDLEHLYGTGVFDQLGFELEKVEGETVLGIDAKTRSWGPNYLRFGLNLKDDFRGSTGFDLGLRYTATGFGRLGAESRTDLRLGEDQSIETELYQPFGAGRWFVAPRVGLSRRNLTIAEGETELASFRVGSALAGFDVGREVSDWGELRVGVELERLRAVPRAGSAGPVVRARDGRAFARFTVDRLDDASFPRRGFAGSFLLNRSFPELGADETASRVSIDSELARSFGAYTLVGGLELGYSFEEGLLFPPYSLGGLFSLSGYRPGEFPGDRVALARLIGYRQFTTLGQKFYLGGSFEGGKTHSDRSDLGTGSLRLSGSLFAGVRTYFGPIYLAYGLGEHQRRNYYFYLGRTF